jgi:hypothetical protein
VDLVQTIVNAVLLGAVGLILGRMFHGLRAVVTAHIAELRTEVRADTAELRTEVRADIAELRTEVRADISDVRREIGELRSDLTQVALAVGARPRAGRGS